MKPDSSLMWDCVPQSCDTMVALRNATVHGQTLFAKNSDRPADECQPLVQRERRPHSTGSITRCQFLEIPEVAETYRHVGSRPYWCWGYEHGFNEHQVVIGNEGLTSKIDENGPGPLGPKLIGMEVLRLGLERGRTAAEAVEAMTDVISRFGQGKFANDAGIRTYDNGYLVADPREAYAIETAGHHWAVKRVERTLGISNVYSLGTGWDRRSPEAESFAAQLGWGGSTDDMAKFDFTDAYAHPNCRFGIAAGDRRRIRSCAVLARQVGDVSVRTMMALLSDHSDAATPDEPFRTDFTHRSGICVHCADDGTGGNTAASLVADLCSDGTRLPVYWCSLYSPCLSVFFPVFLEGTLPAVLAEGGSTPSAESPWWQFHDLARHVRQDPSTRVPALREAWSGLQARFFETAYPLAEEGRQLFDVGKSDEAARILTQYMEENVALVLDRARALRVSL